MEWDWQRVGNDRFEELLQFYVTMDLEEQHVVAQFFISFDINLSRSHIKHASVPFSPESADYKMVEPHSI